MNTGKSRASLFMVFLTLAASVEFRSLVHAAVATVEVKMEQAITDPAEIAVNLRYSNALQVRVTPKVDTDGVSTGIGIQTYDSDGNLLPADDYPLQGRSFLLSFHKCPTGSEEGRERKLQGMLTEPGAKQLAHDNPVCPYAVVSGNKASLRIFTKKGNVPLTIREQLTDNQTIQMTVGIEVDDRAWELDWSAGIGFFNVRDERYRLEPITKDDPNADPNVLPNPDPNSSRIVRIGDGSPGYKVAAFAHYRHQKMPFFLTFGLATDVPSTGIAAMAGISFAAITFPRGNTGYVTMGVSYSEVEKRAADFSGVGRVASGVGSDTIVENRYATGLFLSVNFGFLGGESKFKGRFGGGS